MHFQRMFPDSHIAGMFQHENTVHVIMVQILGSPPENQTQDPYTRNSKSVLLWRGGQMYL